MCIMAAPTPINLANVHGASAIDGASLSCVRTTLILICLEVEPFWAIVVSAERKRRVLAGGVCLDVDITALSPGMFDQDLIPVFMGSRGAYKLQVFGLVNEKSEGMEIADA